MPARPLSPHASVYRLFRYTLFTSFLNRLTGIALSFGFVLLVYWLFALSRGSESYSDAVAMLSQGVFLVVLAGLLFSFVYHLVAGIRHLVWDTGRGLERRQAQRSAWFVGVVSVLLTILFAYLIVRAGVLS